MPRKPFKGQEERWPAKGRKRKKGLVKTGQSIGGGCRWLKTGRFGIFSVLCFLALGGHCLQMLCLPGFGTHANTQNLSHFRASIHCPSLSPEMPIFMANAKLPNRPGSALLAAMPAKSSMVRLCANGVVRKWGRTDLTGF